MTYLELKIHLDLLSKKEKTKFLKNYNLCFVASNKKIFIVCDDGDCHLFDKHGNECDISEIHSIGDYAFFNCTSLTSISIPDSVDSIGNGAFYKCGSLTSISIPDSVKSIGIMAFYDCTSLKSISISDSVESIGYNAFSYCTGLKEVVFRGKTIDEIKAMKHYPWRIEYESIIKRKI